LIRLILVFFILTGCKTTQLMENVKGDFAAENRAVIFNKSTAEFKESVPINGMIFVKKNETIYSIGNKYKVIPKNIIDDNNLIKPYILKENQILFLRNKNVYIIKSGDSIDKIALRFAVNKLDIISLNKLKNKKLLEDGSRILIPAKKNYSVIDQIIDKKIYNVKPNINKYKSAGIKKIKNAPYFIWPAKGEIVKNYGNFGKGQYNDGIDIKLKTNTPIFSSHEGQIAFIGSEIKKFGNLILIKHDNGWLTAYSNIGKYNVKQGQKVTAKQIIAFSSSNEKIFHFQIRYKRNPVNPNDYIN
jgi:murein DD-endopeptidase MepM/ murein hydrolase activator NlpD